MYLLDNIKFYKTQIPELPTTVSSRKFPFFLTYTTILLALKISTYRHRWIVLLKKQNILFLCYLRHLTRTKYSMRIFWTYQFEQRQYDVKRLDFSYFQISAGGWRRFKRVGDDCHNAYSDRPEVVQSNGSFQGKVLEEF